jgi:DNA-directed RNA polymerase subunit L
MASKGSKKTKQSTETFDYDIQLIQHKTDDINKFHITLKGKDVNAAIINTIKRVIMTEVPTFGYHRNNIKIESNTTVTNNDMMRLIIEMIPIYEIEHQIDLFDKISFLQRHKPIADKHNILAIYDNKGKEIPIKDDEKYIKSINSDLNNEVYNKNIKLSAKVHNKSNEIKNITTHDCEFTVDGDIRNTYKKQNPILIARLKPNDKISFTATAELGIEKYGALWATSVIDKYKKISDTEWEFAFHTMGTLSTKSIFNKACNIIIKKLDIIRKYIMDTYADNAEMKKKNDISIILHQETHTMGNLISETLRNHDNVKSAAYNMPHLLIEEVIIYLFTETTNPLKTFEEVMNYLKLLYMEILRQM